MPEANRELATFGGGCFWCTEAVFADLKGVDLVESGYSGGAIENPTYEQVCSGRTGHAEVIQITFDPNVITFRELLEVFLATHDPTTKDRQGADMGTQYRSVVFTHSEEQAKAAHEVIAEVNAAGIYPNPIVTQVVPFERFFKAEGYHQNYFRDNPGQGYCMAVISPKVAKFRQKFSGKLKGD